MKTKKIALIGANGQLGSDIIKVFSKDSAFKVFPLTHADIEITDSANFIKVLGKISPDIVINTAAYHKVDEVEDNPEKAFLVNSIAVKNLAQFCKNQNIVLVFVSSDYVFGLDSKRKAAYCETDTPGPVNVYGLSKLAGEYFIRYIAPKFVIVRSSGLFGKTGSSGKGGNFVETMIKLAKEGKPIKVVSDQVLAPTYSKDLAKQIGVIIKSEKLGFFHAASVGYCSWHEFAKEIFRLCGLKVNLKPVKSVQFSTPAKRPSYSVLENSNLKKFRLNTMRHWRRGLKDYLSEKGYI